MSPNTNLIIPAKSENNTQKKGGLMQKEFVCGIDSSTFFNSIREDRSETLLFNDADV